MTIDREMACLHSKRFHRVTVEFLSSRHNFLDELARKRSLRWLGNGLIVLHRSKLHACILSL